MVGLRPILTAVVAGRFLGERVGLRQWLGLALASISAGTVYQKRYCGAFDLRTGALIRFVAAACALAPFAVALERAPVRWTVEFVGALAWLVVVLSIGAISLLTLLIGRGAATEVALVVRG